jgi:hypothetical protein
MRMRIALAVAVSALMAAPGSALAAAPPDVIRTGGPSRPGDAKIAVVATARSLAGRQFRVLAPSGALVLRGKLVRARGTASPWRRAATADLTAITAPGDYTVAVGRLRSRPWQVADDAPQAAIATVLEFFAANSDGNEPSPVHRPSHLNDAVVASGPHAGQHFDLTGGWMDAGDMIKFTQTIGHSATMLQAAARLDPNQAPALTAAADVGVRWLVKAHPAPGLFIGQVGDERDHDLGFRDPARDDARIDPGIGTRSAYPAVGADLAGKAAAALAMAAQRADGAARDGLVEQAREWYAAGDAAGGAAKLPGDIYASSSFGDDMASGAAELFRATGERQYLADALDWLRGAELDAAFGWDGFGGFAAADVCGLIGAPQLAPDPCGALVSAGQAAITRARRNAFGLPADFGWGSAAEVATSGLSGLMADRAASAAAPMGGRAIATAARGRAIAAAAPIGGSALAAGARDYLLGRNPWGASFVVGYGPRSPRHPHHWASVFGPAKPVGAVVGGPAPASVVKQQKLELRRNVFSTARAFYTDDRNDYVTSEPALDYTADSILLLAALSR